MIRFRKVFWNTLSKRQLHYKTFNDFITLLLHSKFLSITVIWQCIVCVDAETEEPSPVVQVAAQVEAGVPPPVPAPAADSLIGDLLMDMGSAQPAMPVAPPPAAGTITPSYTYLEVDHILSKEFEESKRPESLNQIMLIE